MKSKKPGILVLSCLLCWLGSLSAGEPVGWGANHRGELGDGSTTTRLSPVVMDMTGALLGKSIVEIGGREHSMIARTADGKAFTWGTVTYGDFAASIGDGSSLSSNVAVPVNTSGVLAGKTIQSVAAGIGFFLVSTTEGKAYSWGWNKYGMVGDGTKVDRALPVAVDMTGALAGKTVVSVAAGGFTGFALTSDGKLYGWGQNGDGQISAATVPNPVTAPVEIGGALSGKTIVKCSVGRFHVMALAATGELYAWGDGQHGKLGTGSTTNETSPVCINATGPLAGKTIVALSAGVWSSIVATSDGNAYAFGRNAEGQLGDGTNTDRSVPVELLKTGPLAGRSIVDVNVCHFTNLLVTADGKAFTIGENTSGSLGNGTTTDSTTPVMVDDSGALAQRGILASTPFDTGFLLLTSPPPRPLIAVFDGLGTAGTERMDNVGAQDLGTLGLHNAKTVSFTIKNTGTLLMENLSLSVTGPQSTSFLPGALSTSTLAVGDTVSFSVTFVAGTLGANNAVISVTSSNAYNAPFRINVTGTGVEPAPADAYGYGVNTFGEVGDGSTTTRTTTVRVDKYGALAGKFLSALSAGSYHKLALSTAGKVYAWGLNDVGQLGNGTQINSALPVAVTGVLATKTVTAIAAGAKHSLALTSEGTVYAWGDNGQGQLGINSFSFQTTPAPVDTTGVLAGKTVVGIAAGENNSFAVTSDGLVFAWGYNNSNYFGVPGKLGDGTSTAFRPAPVAVDMTGALADKFVIMVSASENHTLAVTSEGKLYAWGENTTGALGDGTTTDRLSPVAVSMSGVLTGKTIISASAGYDHSVAVSSDGQVFAWGANGSGQLGDGTTTSRLTPVAVDMSGALAGTTIVSVCAASAESVAVTSNGDYFGWGFFAEGQAGSSVFNRLRPVAGDKTGLLQGKTVVTVDRGADSYAFLAYGATPTEADIAVEQPPATDLLSGGVRSFGTVPVSTGAPLTFTVKNVGTATMTGIVASITGTHDSLFSVTSEPAASVIAGESTTVTITFTPDGSGTKSAVLHLASNDPQENPFDIILTGNGGSPTVEELYGWGRNDYGQVGDGTTTNRSTAVAIDKSGALWGKTISAVEGGDFFTLALSSDGRMYAWGANVYGELGNSTNAFSVPPVAVDMHRALLGETVTAISAGGSTAVALTASGKVFMWGNGGQGQRGDGTFSPVQTPWPVDASGVLAGKTITKVSLGGSHTLAMSSEGKVYAWGLNNSGQLGNGSSTSLVPTPSEVDMTGVLVGKTVIAISGGSDFSLALTSQGKVYAWGSNFSGCLGDGTTTDSKVPVAVGMSGALAGKTVIAISAGYGHALALTDEGKVYGWGSGGGAIGDGTTDMRTTPVAVDTSGALAGKFVVAIKASQFHSFALTADGKVYAWGYNAAGLGNGMVVTSAPVEVSGSGSLAGKTAVSIACGAEHTFAITGAVLPGEIAVFDGIGTGGVERTDNVGSVSFPGTVAGSTSTAQSFTIKNNGGGYLTGMTASFSGSHPTDFTFSPVPSGLAPGATATFTLNFTPTGYGTRTAVLNIGSSDANENPFRITVSGTGLKTPRLFAWGVNGFGQLGTGTVASSLFITPVKTDGALAGKAVTSIGRTSSAPLCITSTGEAFGWGLNLYGRTQSDNTNNSTTEPVSVSIGALAGKVVTEVSNGSDYSLALTSDGLIYGWGSNTTGQLGDGTTIQRLAPVAVTMTGALAGKTVTAISAGNLHAAALTSEGKVYCWGYNGVGQLGDGTPHQRLEPVAVDTSGVLAGKTVIAIAAANSYTVALTSEGKLYGWGRNDGGELGSGTMDFAVMNPVAVDTSGVLAGKTITKFGAQTHTVALTSDGLLFAWGSRQSGALGNGTNSLVGQPSPVAVDIAGALAGKTVVDISVGDHSTVALTSDGKAFAWGYNFWGGLGDGTATDQLTPVAVNMPGIDSFTSISAGFGFMVGLAHPSPAPELDVFEGVGTEGAVRSDNSGIATFTTTSVGSSNDQMFTIRNSGDSPLTGLGLSVTGALAGDFSTSTLSSSTLDPGEMAFITVTFSPTTTGTRNATIQIASNDANESPFRIRVSGTGLHTLTSWRETYFPGSTSSTGPGADTATPQNDGIPNLMKFALGMDPSKPGTLPVAVDAGGEFLSYTYTPSVQAVAAGIQFRVEFSQDMSEFSWSWEIVNQGVIGSGGVPVTATVPKPVSGKGFMRLTVTSP